MSKNWRRGKSKNIGVTKNNTTVVRLWTDYDELGTWGAVGAKNGVTKAMAYRVAHGYEPKRKSIRHALGFPDLELIPVCLSCGVVHVSKHCPRQRKSSINRWRNLSLTELREIVKNRKVYNP
jgi:hypothetical protein